MILDRFRLDGRVAVVTGASQGIGQAMARALAEAGADIVNLSRARPAGSEDGTRPLVEGVGRAYRHYPMDLADRASVYRGIEAVMGDVGAPDILVNNAGTILRAPAAVHPDEDWDNVMAVNLSSPFILTREFGRAMLERGSGKVVFTCSLLSFQGGITVPGYAASKAGVARLVMAFSNEWAAAGVNVNGIAPGYIATENTSALRADPQRSQSILARIPAGRWGSPDDLAGACVFLASPAADYIHGSIITVDGGWMGR
jgi:2-dehydro-3-deoxy-D-gluconate 5-dehydrogenase